jgi:hypothetical protein
LSTEKLKTALLRDRGRADTQPQQNLVDCLSCGASFIYRPPEGDEPPGGGGTSNPGCGRSIPNWRNGKRVSSKTRFCSPACKKKCWRAGTAGIADCDDPDAKTPSAVRVSSDPQPTAVARFSVPLNLFGPGYRHPDAPKLDPETRRAIWEAEIDRPVPSVAPSLDAVQSPDPERGPSAGLEVQS